MFSRGFLFLPVLAIALVASSQRLFADHGPGTTGGSVSTQGGETIDAGDLELELRLDYTDFESLSDASAARRALKVDGDHPHFEALDWSLLTNLFLSYGITDDLEISTSIGVYRGDDLREGEIHDDHGDEAEVDNLGDVSGITDMWVNAKYRVLKGSYGHLAPIVGVKLPTGKDDATAEGTNERLDPSLQPGTGAFDFRFGLAYTLEITSQVKVNTSASYILRTEGNDFRVGDRIDYGIAGIWRLMEDRDQFPQVSLIGEIDLVNNFKNEEGDHTIQNSGGTILFLSPGVAVGLNERVTLTVMPQFPVMQDLNDEQQEISFKLSTALTIDF
jgi:hypothetical protein